MISEIKVADSLINDLYADVQRMEAISHLQQREGLAKELLAEASNIFCEIDRAIDQGDDIAVIAYVRAKAHNAKGNVYLCVASSPELQASLSAGTLDEHQQNFLHEWADKALAEFTKSLQCHSTPASHYDAGLALLLMGQKEEAKAAFHKAQQGGSQEIAMKAAEKISRLQEKECKGIIPRGFRKYFWCVMYNGSCMAVLFRYAFGATL